VPLSVRPGDVLAGRYRLVDLLAESGGGRFWRARDSVLERHVAVHVISADDERAAALLEAARRSAMVLDQRILRVLDAEQVDDICYVINEWGSGTSLDILVGAIGALGPRRSAWLVSEVAASIAAAHAAGVAHGRLVPENVLIDRHGEVKIIGMCVDAAMHGLAGDRIATDVSDLAGLLYCSLTGRWGGVSSSSVPSAPAHHGEVLRPRRVRAGIPGQLDALCDEVLHAHHNSRRAIGVGSARGICDFLTDYVGDPKGMADALRDTVPPSPETPKIALPSLPDPAVRTDPPAEPQPGPAPDPEPQPEPQPEPDPDPPGRAVEELPTEAGLPIFGDGIDDVSWLEKRKTPAPPPPPFEKQPERPLFAPEPSDGRPVRRARPGVAQPSSNGYWPFDADTGRPRTGGGVTTTGSGTGAGLTAVPEDDPVPGRSWLRLAAGIAAGLMLLVAVVVAYNLGRGKTPLGAEPDSDPTPSTPTQSAAASALVTDLVASDLDPQGDGGTENPEDAPLAVDGDPQTAWSTVSYDQQFGPGGLKTGVGLVVDLGARREVTQVDLSFLGSPTKVELYLADSPPADVTGLDPVAGGTAGGESLSLELEEPGTGRFLVVWLTSLPTADDGRFRGEVAEVRVEAVVDGE
jgi:hypothetical protein